MATPTTSDSEIRMVDGLFMVDINHQQSHQPLPMVDGLLKFDKNGLGGCTANYKWEETFWGIGHLGSLRKHTDDGVKAAWQGPFFFPETITFSKQTSF